MYVLVINSGSSSIKYQLIDMPGEHIMCSGLVERISLEQSMITHKIFKEGVTYEHKIENHIANHKQGLEYVADLLTNYEHAVIQDHKDIAIVSHRVVHGGDKFVQTTLVTPDVKAQIKELIVLAPLHNPANLLGIEVAEELFTNAKQVAVFDTAFHQTIPENVYRYALPENFYKESKVRLYGFHGISHEYVSKKASQYLELSKYKLITLHLGNGCSAAAIKDGRSVETSMGMGPLGGLVMGTRPGDIDPSALLHIVGNLGYTYNEVSEILNKHSGMQALTGFSDMREISDLYYKGDKKAILAYDMAAHRIKKYIGAYCAAMNGIDALIFTGGIGENDSLMRKLVTDNLNNSLGIAIDDDKNKTKEKCITDISKIGAKVKTLIVPTNEELEIAIQAYKCCVATGCS